MDERSTGLEFLFTLHETIEGWPANIDVSIGHYEASEYVIFVSLKSPGVAERHYTMRWKPHPFLPEASWQFETPLADSPTLPDELYALEEKISELVINIDL